MYSGPTDFSSRTWPLCDSTAYPITFSAALKVASLFASKSSWLCFSASFLASSGRYSGNRRRLISAAMRSGVAESATVIEGRCSW